MSRVRFSVQGTRYGVFISRRDTNCGERLLIAWVSTIRRESTREEVDPSRDKKAMRAP